METNGFYDLSKLSDEYLKELIKDAITFSFKAKIEYISEESWARKDRNLSDLGLGNIHLKISSTTHNVFIDRSVQDVNRDYFEIGFSYDYYDRIFLFCYLHKDNAKKLIDKYNL